MKRKAVIILIIGIGILSYWSGFAVSEVRHSYANRIISVDDIPSRSVALVLGASVKRGKPNTSLEDRLTVAQELYNAKKVKKLLVSGDNRREDYNEPQVMRQYLIEHGVPESDVIADYAGRRTYDSCYRAKEIFGQNSLIVITQEYHLYRALYLCNRLGIDAVGIAADRQEYQGMIQRTVREFGASLLAWINIRGIVEQPVLGEKENVFDY